MLRSLLLVGAGAASGWFAHRALGDRAHPATDGTDAPTSGPGSAGGHAGFSARLDPERLARQAGDDARLVERQLLPGPAGIVEECQRDGVAA